MEGQLLADFLIYGGNLCMEGSDTWYYDNQTAVHLMFNIKEITDGSDDMNTVLGRGGTFSGEMSFNYSGDNNWLDHIETIAPAAMILKNQSPSYGTGVTFDGNSYKTIGTSHEFGGLDDGIAPSAKVHLI